MLFRFVARASTSRADRCSVLCVLFVVDMFFKFVFVFIVVLVFIVLFSVCVDVDGVVICGFVFKIKYVNMKYILVL